MRWFAFSPLLLFGLVALGSAVVALLVESAEWLRSRRNPPRLRHVFRPVVIQGGKAPALPDAQGAPEDSKIESRIA